MASIIRRLPQISPYVFLALFAVLGYGSYVLDTALFDDDIAGRFKAVQNPTAISASLANIQNWSMGRPLGHASNVAFQTIFLDVPEGAILAFAFAALSLQSFVVYRLAVQTGFGARASFIAAAVFLVSPAAISLNLVVHSLATEWSTWFILAACALALQKRFILAGAVAALQVNVYEIYLTIFFLPFLFPLSRAILNKELVVKGQAINFAKYTASFLAVFAFFLWVRAAKGAAGRAGLIDDMGIIEVIGRMISAGWIGLGTLFDLHLSSFEWSMQHGPTYIFGFLVLMVVASFSILRSRALPSDDDDAADTVDRQRQIVLAGIFLLAGIGVIYMSYMVFFAQRYPPEWQFSRLANIHAGSRFGLFFVAIGLVQAALWFAASSRNWSVAGRSLGIANWSGTLGVGFASLVLGVFATFNHAYGYQQAQQSLKKYALVDSLALACEQANAGDTIIIVLPPRFEVSPTDRVMTWGVTYLGDTQFSGWDNHYLLVRHHNRGPLLDAIAADGNVTGESLVPIVDPAFSRYAFLFPRGDVARWTINEDELVVAELSQSRGVYETEFLIGATPELRTCRRRIQN